MEELEPVKSDLPFASIIRRFNVCGSVYRKYIPIYIQQDATLHSLFISGNCSTCFGWYLHPSSGPQTTVSTACAMSHRYCYLPLSWKSWMHGPINVKLDFSLKNGYTGSLKLDCYYLLYVSASKHFDHAWFEVLEAITVYCTWSDIR
jgi:hypothetical protein